MSDEIITEMTAEGEKAPVKDPISAIEAIMFAAGYPVRYDKIAAVLSISIGEVKRYVSELAQIYNADSHGIQVLEFPETCQLCTKEQYGTQIREALGIKRGGNLSSSSMEVLAIIAYNQPATRSFVDLVRGVDSSYAMNSLIDKGLIECSGRLEAPGRPMLYSTTDKFLRVFGISSTEELPEVELLRASDEQMEIVIPESEQADTQEG